MCPTSPAPPQYPSCRRPPDMMPPPMPVLTVTYTRSDTASCNAKCHSPSAASVASFASLTGLPNRSCSSARSGVRRSESTLGEYATTPSRVLTMPAHETPTEATASSRVPAAASASRVTRSTSSTSAAASPPSGVAPRDLPSRLPSASATAAAIFVPPISTTSTGLFRSLSCMARAYYVRPRRVVNGGRESLQ